MGAWGVSLFSNDIAQDAKEFYIDCLKKGMSDEEAYQCVLDECKDYLVDEDDKIDFWLGFASLLDDYGRLTQEAKNCALSLIQSEKDLERWSEPDRLKRIGVLNELKEKLDSDAPPRKKISVYKQKVPKVNPNEVFYLRLDDEQFKDKPYYNCYLFLMVDSWEEYDLVSGLGDQNALVFLKLCKQLPKNNDELDAIPFFIMNYDAVVEGVQDTEKRVMMHPQGFNTLKKILIKWGTFDFRREYSDKGDYYCDGQYRDIYTIHKSGKRIWVGPSTLWKVLVRDVVLILDICVGAEKLIN